MRNGPSRSVFCMRIIDGGGLAGAYLQPPSPDREQCPMCLAVCKMRVHLQETSHSRVVVTGNHSRVMVADEQE